MLSAESLKGVRNLRTVFFAGECAMQLLVDAAQAATLIGVSERTFHTFRRKPGFPAPVDGLGPRLIRWRRADLEAWVAGLPAAQAAGEPPQLRRGKANKPAPAWAPVPQ